MRVVNEKHMMLLAFAVLVLFFTAFAIGYSRYCYDRGFKDGYFMAVKQTGLSKYIK